MTLRDTSRVRWMQFLLLGLSMVVLILALVAGSLAVHRLKSPIITLRQYEFNSSKFDQYQDALTQIFAAITFGVVICCLTIIHSFFLGTVGIIEAKGPFAAAAAVGALISLGLVISAFIVFGKCPKLGSLGHQLYLTGLVTYGDLGDGNRATYIRFIDEIHTVGRCCGYDGARSNVSHPSIERGYNDWRFLHSPACAREGDKCTGILFRMGSETQGSHVLKPLVARARKNPALLLPLTCCRNRYYDKGLNHECAHSAFIQRAAEGDVQSIFTVGCKDKIDGIFQGQFKVVAMLFMGLVLTLSLATGISAYLTFNIQPPRTAEDMANMAAEEIAQKRKQSREKQPQKGAGKRGKKAAQGKSGPGNESAETGSPAKASKARAFPSVKPGNQPAAAVDPKTKPSSKQAESEPSKELPDKVTL